MESSITIQISADKAMLKRIAKSVDRRSADLNQLIFARGLEYFFCEEHVWVDKLPDEYTEEERQQQEKNKAIRENPEIKGRDAQQKAGYVVVRAILQPITDPKPGRRRPPRSTSRPNS